MQIIADDAGRELNIDERSFVSDVFKKANTSQMKYLGTNGTIIDKIIIILRHYAILIPVFLNKHTRKSILA